MSISKVFGFRKWSFLFTPSDKATNDMTHDFVWLSFLQAHWLATVLVKIILIYAGQEACVNTLSVTAGVN